MAALASLARATAALSRSTPMGSVVRTAASTVGACQLQAPRHMSSAADGGGRQERDDTTWAAFDDPAFLGEDFSTVKPENVGRAKSRVSAADRAAFMDRLAQEPDVALDVGEHHAWDPEAWPMESSRVKAMPHWMMMQYAQSELESDAEGTDFEDNTKLVRWLRTSPPSLHAPAHTPPCLHSTPPRSRSPSVTTRGVPGLMGGARPPLPTPGSRSAMVHSP